MERKPHRRNMPLPGRWLRRRGYGIHSPFIYALARDMVSAGRGAYGESPLYGALTAEGVGKAAAQRLCAMERYFAAQRTEVYVSSGSGPVYENGREEPGRWKRFTILCVNEGGAALPEGMEKNLGPGTGNIVAITGRRRVRQNICMAIAAFGECLCIDMRGISVYICDDNLPVGQYNM